MKEKLKGIFERVPKWVRGVVACAVVIGIAIVADHCVQDYIYKNQYKIVRDNYDVAFQIDEILQKDSKLVLKGWVFEPETDSLEDDFDIILYDYNDNKEFYMNVEDILREDVNKYFLCEYDYSKSGFIASIKLKKLDLDEKNYEVLIRPKGVRNTYKSGVYISDGELIYAKPESFVALDVKGTELEPVINNGVLRLYRSDVGMYVYQYNDKLYWIADSDYEFESDASTYIEYQLWTTQIDNLPKRRLEKNHLWDNIGFVFEKKEDTAKDYGSYRVAVLDIPKEYSIVRILTGYYIDGWIWMQNFRPYYYLDK